MGQIALLVDAGGGGDVELRRQIAAIDHRVVTHHGTVTDMAVEQHAVEADKDPVSHFARSVDDGAVGDGGVLADGDGGAGFGVDHHAILDIGVGADDDGFHISTLIHLVGTDHRIGADKDILFDDHLAADDGGLVDIGGFVDDRQMAGGILADHVTSCGCLK